MFDITSQSVADTATLHLKDANGAPLYDDKGSPLRIVLYGPGSQPFTMVEERQTARAVKRANENEGKVQAIPAAQRLAEQAEDLAALTVAFENFNYPPAADKLGTEHFRAFYADPKLNHLTQQALKFVQNWGNFKPGSVGN